jgi:ribosomal protein S18 acetylase RimI-like enzyme
MTAPEPVVSTAHDEDAEAIRELLRGSSNSFDVDAELQRRYARLWVARDRPEERPLGVALAWEVVDEMHLIDLLVVPSARRRGLGRALVSAVVAYAERGAFRVVLLEVRRDNEAARALYGALGFELSGERARYYSDGEDAILMQRTLREGPP